METTRESILIVRAAVPLSTEHMANIHRMMVEQLKDGVLVLPSHVGFTWLRPGESIPSPQWAHQLLESRVLPPAAEPDNRSGGFLGDVLAWIRGFFAKGDTTVVGVDGGGRDETFAVTSLSAKRGL